METPEKGIREQLIRQKYPITGRGDFESNSRDLVREIGQEKEESVYLLTNFIDGTYRFDRIADGGTGEVSFDASRLQLRKWITNYVIYHNHPLACEPTLSPPSSDDFMTASRIHSSSIVHKIITEHWVWRYQATDIKKAQEISQKLGTLLNYLVGDYTPTELSDRTKILQWIHPAYASVASAYAKLLNSADITAITEFKWAIGKLGFAVDFEERK
jgi:hypothetical protein